MATHWSNRAWKIPWTVCLVWYSPWGSQRVGHDWATEHAQLGKVSHGENAWDEVYTRQREGSWWEHIPGSGAGLNWTELTRWEEWAGQRAAGSGGMDYALGDHLDLVPSHPLPLTSWVALKAWPSWACLLGSKNGMTHRVSCLEKENNMLCPVANRH